MVIELTPKGEKATLELIVDLPNAGPLPGVPPVFNLYLSHPGNEQESERHVVRLKDRRLRLIGLDGGKYQLLIAPGGSGFALRDATYYRNRRMEIALEEGRTTRRALRLEPAGRLRILVRDPEGRTNIAAEVDLRDAAGRTVDTNFAKYSSGMTNVSSGVLPANVGPAEVTSPLLPGRYALRLTPLDSDLKPRTVTLEIEVGRTHLVEVDLHR